MAAASGFGLLGVLSRFSYDAGLQPLPFVAWRAAFGLVVIAVVVMARRQIGIRVADPRQLARRDGIGLLVCAVTALGLNVAMFFAFDLAAVAIVLLAFYTYPALVALVAVTLGHERLDALGWSALALSLGGMVLVVAGGLDTSGAAGATRIHPLGVALGLAAAACQTVFVTVSRGRFRALPSEQAMGWIFLVTMFAAGSASVVTGAGLTAAFASPRVLGLVLATGVVTAGIPSILFLAGIRAIGGTRAGILMLIEPLVGVTLAAVLLGETLHPGQAIGGIAILVAALLLQRSAPATEAIEPAGVAAVERT